MSDKFSFCPICQLPLKAISISPDVHVSMCMTKCDDSVGLLEECPQGVHCLNTDIFHYRDFSHKLLAAYRSSSDFVPPNIDIKPSPKKRKTPIKQKIRSSPRKRKTPSESDLKNNVASDIESDSEVPPTPTKRPRRSLKFSKKSNETHPQKNKSNSSSVKKVKNVSNKSSADSVLCDETKAIMESSDDEKVSEIKKESSKGNVNKATFEKSSIVNISLSSGDELRLRESCSNASFSSLSVSTSKNSKIESDSDSGKTSRRSIKKVVKPASKIVLKEPVLTLDNLNTHEEKLDSCSKNVHVKIEPTKILLKEPVLSIGKLKTQEKNSEALSKTISNEKKSSKKSEIANKPNENETACSFDKTNFDDMIPASMLDKELLQTIKKRSDSPATTVHSCSDYNGNDTCAASVAEDGTTDGDNESMFLDPPSSPEVIIPSRPRRKSAVHLSSSSDSDIPLSKLTTKKPETVLSKITEVKGKVKAGKVLRTPSKTPVYLNGLSLLKTDLINTEVNATSDKESDSGKSSAHTDVSFVPTEKTSSSIRSDSALSAQFTDRLTASSLSSTYSSSEPYTESRSSDPSYSEESDGISSSKDKETKNPKLDRRTSLSPRKKGPVKPLLSSEESSSINSSSSSSEISIREKLLFGTRKPSPKKTLPKLIKTPVKPKQSFKPSTLGLLDTTDSDDKSEWQSLLCKMRNGCFPSDLKIDSEDSLTVVSSCSGSDTSQASNMLPSRQCPFYKRIPDTPFAVDAFQYWNIPGVHTYFLSHFHSDHYIGMKKNFAHPIYCTRITANLVRMKLRVEEKWLRVIELNQPQIISGVEVTALDANHCPGSVMFLFSLRNGRNHLHVGDFRASKAMTFYPSLRSVSISKLFLDTTYCSPQYCFPTQEEVISRVVDIVRNHVKIHPRTLVVCGSYTIGKEKVFLGIAEALDWRVWGRPEKQRVFACINDPRINCRLIKDCRSANVHVLPMASLQIRCLQQHLESCTGAFTHVIGVKPTGWELNAKSGEFKVTSRDNIIIYGVPYSEHSSFTELRDFVHFLQPHEIIPTVNVVSAASRGKMSKHFSDWLRSSSETDGKPEKQTKVSQYFKTAS